ncbi:MAG: hypothetical protein QGH73_01020 [Rhodospirillales bacterium]|nr:hypothetical protein [Rhodospirillales bacterium]MDP6643635.1 hypothetical protein [Rhodospirillales bacterium]MDP6840238.1 hypothetical protein [Rhodospirillales bacterium]
MPYPSGEFSERTEEDLIRAVRSIGSHFKTDTVFIIGSQAILLDQPAAPANLRTTDEIDAYPGNFEEWEARNPDNLASEEINAWFGAGSDFHETFGFYIDGVDENTAKFPPGWKARAIRKTLKDGAKFIHVVAPCLEDLIVSKLHRLDPKDKKFIQACGQMQPLNLTLIKARLEETKPAPEIIAGAFAFLDSL